MNIKVNIKSSEERAADSLAYYYKNKEKKQVYSLNYYHQNKEKILEKLRIKRLTKLQNLNDVSS